MAAKHPPAKRSRWPSMTRMMQMKWSEGRCRSRSSRWLPPTIKPNLSSDSKRSFNASVWNLLSQRYKDAVIGLKGSKSIVTFFSWPSSVTIVPVYRTRPFGGTLLYSFGLYWAEVMAAKTDWRLTLHSVFEAVPYSSLNILVTRDIYLITRRHNQWDHTCTIASSRLECLNQLFDLVSFLTVRHLDRSVILDSPSEYQM